MDFSEKLKKYIGRKIIINYDRSSFSIEGELKAVVKDKLPPHNTILVVVPDNKELLKKDRWIKRVLKPNGEIGERWGYEPTKNGEVEVRTAHLESSVDTVKDSETGEVIIKINRIII